MRSSLEEPWPSNFWCRELFDKCTKEKKNKKKEKRKNIEHEVRFGTTMAKQH
jgi:hypothetical protein